MIIRRHKWDNKDIRFLTTRGYHSVVGTFGFPSFDLDKFFNVPYVYQNRRADSWKPLRELALHVREYCGFTRVLFLPHTRDPMMQLILSCVRSSQLMFLEEGCLFPRKQIDGLLSTFSWQDLVAFYKHDEQHFFAVPSFLTNRPQRPYRYYSTLDNCDVTGIQLALVSDKEIRDLFGTIFFTHLKGTKFCRDSIIIIGTKDDLYEGVFGKLINAARLLARRYKKDVCYHPHPSLKLACLPHLNELIGMHGVHISDIECIEAALYTHKKMILCGDASTITITARRLGHKYFLLTNSIHGLIPRRGHQEDPSVQHMLHKKF